MARRCTDRWGRTVRCRSGWNHWGRWVALAVILVVAFLIFFAFACISARRRRRRGMRPFMGTGWAAHNARMNQQQQQQQQQPPPPPHQNIPPQYGQQYHPPPQYTPSDSHFGQNADYYGATQPQPYQQPQGVEMQPPQNAYQPADSQNNMYGYGSPPAPQPSKQ